MDVYQKYELMEPLQGVGPKSFRARLKGQGTAVTVHFLVGGLSPANQALLARLRALPPNSLARMLEAGNDSQGTLYVVTVAPPLLHLVDWLNGQEEAAAIFGKDPRQFQVQTKRILGDAKGQVRAIEVVEVRFAAQTGGPPKIEEVPGTVRELPADLVLLAMGFLGPEKAGLLSDLGVKLDGRGNVAVDADKQTSVPGVFAAGDMSRGQSLVVWAIAEGRDAAIGIDRFLMGDTVLE